MCGRTGELNEILLGIIFSVFAYKFTNSKTIYLSEFIGINLQMQNIILLIQSIVWNTDV